jgi:hypothetical protein
VNANEPETQEEPEEEFIDGVEVYKDKLNGKPFVMPEGAKEEGLGRSNICFYPTVTPAKKNGNKLIVTNHKKLKLIHECPRAVEKFTPKLKAEFNVVDHVWNSFSKEELKWGSRFCYKMFQENPKGYACVKYSQHPSIGYISRWKITCKFRSCTDERYQSMGNYFGDQVKTSVGFGYAIRAVGKAAAASHKVAKLASPKGAVLAGAATGTTIVGGKKALENMQNPESPNASNPLASEADSEIAELLKGATGANSLAAGGDVFKSGPLDANGSSGENNVSDAEIAALLQGGSEGKSA